MGTQQSSQTQIQKYWQQTLTSLPLIPGKPKLVQSIRRPTLQAQRYTNQMIDTNQQQQASIFRERKISHQNIVNVYDFQIRKGLLGCARNANFYDIVTQRIKYRLATFSNLSCEEMIYVFHQALCGYGQLYRYDKLCYPNANMIGIKQTGEVKVWINQNWSDNSYRACRYESMSIDTLWNCIKMCGDSRGLVKFNQMYYKLDSVDFQNVMQAIRSNFSKEIMEGRFELQARMKNIGLEEQNKSRGIITPIITANDQEQNYIRPRAVSEQLRRKQHNVSGAPNIQYKNINQIVYQDQLDTPYKRLSDYKQADNNLLATKTSLKSQFNVEKPQSSYPYRKQYQPISTPIPAYQTQNLYLSSANHVIQRQPNLTFSQAYTKKQSPQTQPHTQTQIFYKNQTQQLKKPQSITPNKTTPVIQYISKSLDNNTHVRYEHTPPSQKRYVKQNDSSYKNKILVQNYITNQFNQGGLSGQNYHSIGPKIGQIILVPPHHNKTNPSHSQTISFTTSQQNSKQNLHKNIQTPPSQNKLNYSTNPHTHPSPPSHPSPHITYNLSNTNNQYDKKKLVNFNYNQNNVGFFSTNVNLNNYQTFGVGNNYGYGYKNSQYVPQNLQRTVAIKLDNSHNAHLNSNNSHKIKLRDRKQYHIQQPYSQQNQNLQSQLSQIRTQQPQTPSTPKNNHINEIPQLQLNLQLIQNRKEGLPSKQDYSTQRPALYLGQNINTSSNQNSNANSQITRYEFKSQRQTMQDKQKFQSIRQMDITEIPFGTFAGFGHQNNQNLHNIPTSPPTATQPYIFESPVKSNKKKNLQIYPQIQIHNYSTISEKQLSNEQQSQLQNSSDSRKVAQQFKYYLRSIQKSPKKNQQSQLMTNNLATESNQNPNNSNSNNSKYNSPYQSLSQKKPRNLYDASIIPERWQEQQSFSQIL